MQTPEIFFMWKIIVNYRLLSVYPHGFASKTVISGDNLPGTHYDLVKTLNKTNFLGMYGIDKSVIGNINYFATFKEVVVPLSH